MAVDGVTDKTIPSVGAVKVNSRSRVAILEHQPHSTDWGFGVTDGFPELHQPGHSLDGAQTI